LANWVMTTMADWRGAGRRVWLLLLVVPVGWWLGPLSGQWVQRLCSAWCL
jgi:hypothetical protein